MVPAPTPMTDAARGALPRGPLFTARLLHSYMLVIHLALPAILYYLVGRSLDVGALFTPSTLAQITPAFADASNQVLALFALVVFALGWLLPGRIARGVLARLRKPAAAPAPAVLFQASLLPFIVRISLFEMTTVLGFVIGMRTGVVAAALPFAAAGLAATLLSPPTPAFLTGLFGDANLAPSHSS